MALENLATRLKMLRESKGLTKYRLSKLSGISETYLYRLELGEIKNPRRDTLAALADGLGITLSELIGETAPQEAWQLVEQSLKAYIPVYTGIYEVGMNPVDYVVCTRAEIPPDTVRGFRIQGLSLEPEIREGDILIADSALMPRDGDLVLVGIEGHAAIVHYHQDENGGRWLEDDGERYAWEAVSVCGVITEIVRKLR